MSSSDEMRRLLIVDDEEDLRAILFDVTRSLGIPADTAGDGVEALDRIKSGSYAAMLCDIRMPRLDGIELLAELSRQSISLPTVILTGASDQDAVLDCLRLGAIDFLCKPFQFEEIALAISQVLDLGARQRRVAEGLKGSRSLSPAQAAHEQKMISLLRLMNYAKKTKSKS
jgi:DNA-binding NtrC family response regulator